MFTLVLYFTLQLVLCHPVLCSKSTAAVYVLVFDYVKYNSTLSIVIREHGYWLDCYAYACI